MKNNETIKYRLYDLTLVKDVYDKVNSKAEALEKDNRSPNSIKKDIELKTLESLKKASIFSFDMKDKYSGYLTDISVLSILLGLYEVAKENKDLEVAESVKTFIDEYGYDLLHRMYKVSVDTKDILNKYGPDEKQF